MDSAFTAGCARGAPVVNRKALDNFVQQ